MAHSIKSLSCLLLAYWLMVGFASCSMRNNREKTIGNQQESSFELIRDSLFLGLSDSVLNTVPILPGDCLSSEQRIWDLDGIDLPVDGKKVILRISLPESLVSPRDLESFVPHRKICIIGRWIVNHNIDTYIIKETDTDETDCAVFLVSKMGNALGDILDVAFVAREYTCADVTLMPMLSEINDDNMVVVFSLDKNRRQDEKSFTITDSGKFVQIGG